MKERTITLNPGEMKNGRGRQIYLDNELLKLFKGLNLHRKEGCPYVFHRNGRKIEDFRTAWKDACKAAGLSGKLFHDLRRTCARNLIRSGTSETVAMKITGHVTRDVFQRYNITSSEDLKAAAERQSAYLSQTSCDISVTSEQKSAEGQEQAKAQVVKIA
jgi:integrase